jgi:phosphate-selective porin OprO/OprP
LNDVSFTVNYYINKYMIWRFRYSYTKITDRVGFENQSLSAFQTRFQVIF